MEDRLYRTAVNRYGKQAQLIVAVEELAELQKEITKHLRGENNQEHITEEIADVEIMLEQVKMMCDINESQITVWKKRKRERLKKKLEDDCYVSGRS